jgi:hypothetical protein
MSDATGTAARALPDVQIILTAMERGTSEDVVAWASVVVRIEGVDMIVHGITITRDEECGERVCRTPHHRRDGKLVPSVEVPNKIADGIAQVVFAALDAGYWTKPSPLPRPLQGLVN